MDFLFGLIWNIQGLGMTTGHCLIYNGQWPIAENRCRYLFSADNNP